MDGASIHFMNTEKTDKCTYHDENSNGEPSKQPMYTGNSDTRIYKQAIAYCNIYIKIKLRGFILQANYIDRATAPCRQS
jgi:hypothetical protein